MYWGIQRDNLQNIYTPVLIATITRRSSQLILRETSISAGCATQEGETSDVLFVALALSIN